MATDIRDIVVRPWWNKWVWGFIFLIASVFIYFVLQDLTSRINEANDRADVNAEAVDALAAQVESLGAIPVLTPDDLPESTPGPAGATGADGLSIQGPVGPAGVDGQDGTDGQDGADGRNGRNGEDGIAVDGVDGTDGTQGPIGPVGPEGPVGPTGPVGPAGKDGVDGADGQTCPEGFTLEERQVPTDQNPVGESVVVCVQNAQPEDQARN